MKKQIYFLALILSNTGWAKDLSSFSIQIWTGSLFYKSGRLKYDQDVQAFMSVTDPSGHQTGMTSPTAGPLFDIPNSSYVVGTNEVSEDGRGPEHIEFFVFRPTLSGTYKVDIGATKTTNYSMSIELHDQSGNTLLSEKDSAFINSIKPTSPQRFELTVDFASGAPIPTLHAAFFYPTPFVKRTATSCNDATLSGNAVIAGSLTASKVSRAGNSKVTGVITISTVPIDCNTIDLDSIAQGLTKSNDNAKLPSANVKNGVLEVKGSDNISLPAGNYLLEGLSLSGNGKLTAGGSVHLLVKGAVTMTGNAVAAANDPKDLMIFTNATADVTMGGNAQAQAILYAPKGPIKLSGSAKVKGNIFGNGLDLSGNAQVQ